MISVEQGTEGPVAKLSRTPILIAAVICGIMAFVGVTASIYTFVSTPVIRDIPVYLDRVGATIESKELYLFAMPLFLAIVSLVLGYYALTWNEFIRKQSAEIEFYRKARASGLRVVNIPLLFNTISVGFCAGQGFALFVALSRCQEVFELLNKS
jgi:hypothetical protein